MTNYGPTCPKPIQNWFKFNLDRTHKSPKMSLPFKSVPTLTWTEVKTDPRWPEHYNLSQLYLKETQICPEPNPKLFLGKTNP